MIHQTLDLFLTVFLLRLPFGNHIPDEFMIPFTSAFLIAVHRVTVEYTALDLSAYILTPKQNGAFRTLLQS